MASSSSSAAPAVAAAAAPAAAATATASKDSKDTKAAAAAQKGIVLVTGANKGIGYAIVEQLAKHGDLVVLLASRDQKRGEAAVKALGKTNVQALALDVDDEKSIIAAAASVKAQFGGLDILINNAGMAWKGDAFNEEVASTTIRTNYYGVLHMMNHFIPLMKQDGRIVNVSSMAGRNALRKMSKANSDKFMDAKLTVPELTALVEQFKSDVKDNTWADKGWPKSTYGISKAGVTMLTRIVARDNKRADLLINACCPGWVRTDMAGQQAPKSPAEGALTPVHLALLTGNQSGLFWEDLQVSAFM